MAYALAEEQLLLGFGVVAECVNPMMLTRNTWRSTAERAHAAIVEVELVCSDFVEHRRRVQTRSTDVEGVVKPGWEEVARREYHSWDRPHVVIDTAETSAAEAAKQILVEITAARNGVRIR